MLKIETRQRLGTLNLETDLQLPASGVTALFGRSGSGKTSLINQLAGLSRPDSGRIQLNDQLLFDSRRRINLPPEKRRVGYVFQDARLFPHYRVRGNLLYGQRRRNPEKLARIVDLLGIGRLLERYPATLSGGEKQRVAIGRALLSDPQLLLMDEPLASLDLPRKRELLPWLERLAREVRLPILYVSHSLEEVLHLADRMVLLNSGQVVAQGPLEQVWQSEQLQPWLPAEQRSSLLQAEIAEHHPQYRLSALSLSDELRLWVPQLAHPPGRPVRLMVAAQDVSLCLQRPQQTSIRNILPARVKAIRPDPDGPTVQVELAVGRQTLFAAITHWALQELQLSTGQSLFAQLKSVSISQQDLAEPPTGTEQA
ncbi:molybdenum ABC transporter ATP-binding protein ModC [Marinobacterium arenosum]|uniref:molybdenum ABC transporter ATP-binding protein ModC n=1 Tax=Marinobacterium arenosum TaxID=2862496 RepID=UPI001C9665CC|nr:molybdenum ABC transporter ATP-binding protein ModC [Marinobacterium arenosum]MBY4677793.1 molybdenum ABC transporter ATP-binding protein ModC [Marinobacterium arenosum]